MAGGVLAKIITLLRVLFPAKSRPVIDVTVDGIVIVANLVKFHTLLPMLFKPSLSMQDVIDEQPSKVLLGMLCKDGGVVISLRVVTLR